MSEESESHNSQKWQQIYNPDTKQLQTQNFAGLEANKKKNFLPYSD